MKNITTSMINDKTTWGLVSQRKNLLHTANQRGNIGDGMTTASVISAAPVFCIHKLENLVSPDPLT
jgi:hypothetical protein